MSARRPIVALFGSCILVLVVAACGGDDGGDDAGGSSSPFGGGGGGGGQVDVAARDISFDEDGYEVDAGTVTFDYTNDGALQHSLLIEGIDGFKLEVQKKGDADEGSVELEAGTYTIYCDVAGHRQAGMHATLEVG